LFAPWLLGPSRGRFSALGSDSNPNLENWCKWVQ